MRNETNNTNNRDESNPSDELLEAIDEARTEYSSGKMKSYSSVDDFISHLKK